MQVDTMTIIGAGTMGTGIAQVAAQAGIEVHLIDTSEDALERSRGILRRSLNGAIEREKLTEDQAAEVEGRITWGMDREAVAGADWIDYVELCKNGSRLMLFEPEPNWAAVRAPVTRAKIRIDWGWGAKDKVVRWEGKLSLGDGVRAYQFRDGPRGFAVVWAPAGVKAKPIALANEKLVAWDIMGRPQKGRTFTPGGTPVYVVGEGVDDLLPFDAEEFVAALLED